MSSLFINILNDFFNTFHAFVCGEMFRDIYRRLEGDVSKSVDSMKEKLIFVYCALFYLQVASVSNSLLSNTLCVGFLDSVFYILSPAHKLIKESV